MEKNRQQTGIISNKIVFLFYRQNETVVQENQNIMKPKFYCLGLIFLLISGIGAAQTRIVSGAVSDENGDPVPGVVIFDFTNSKYFCMSDRFGGFYIQISENTKKVEFRYIGMLSKIYDVDSIPTCVVLADDPSVENAVIITALNIQPSKKNSGDHTNITYPKIELKESPKPIFALIPSKPEPKLEPIKIFPTIKTRHHAPRFQNR